MQSSQGQLKDRGLLVGTLSVGEIFLPPHVSLYSASNQLLFSVSFPERVEILSPS